MEQQGGFLGVRKPRSHQDAAAGAATEGRCSENHNGMMHSTNQTAHLHMLFQYLKAWKSVVSHCNGVEM